MKIQLDFDNKEVTILDSILLSKLDQILKDLGIPDDWKIKSEQKIHGNYEYSFTPVYPNLPYSPDFIPDNPNKIIC